ncbi:MAG: hypothetical protein EAZ36_06870, partial [Verrucomicrobia bacterium]
MTVPPRPVYPRARLLAGLGCILGAVLLAAAWAVPVHLGALAPALLVRAATGTPSLAELGEARLESAQPGAAALLLAGARATAAQPLGEPTADARAWREAERLQAALKDFAQREPGLMPWGGDDPFLLPLARQPAARTAAERGESVPVLSFFVTAEARVALRGFLAHSKLGAVRDTLTLGALENTGRFVPANRPGGQAYEALILLAALLQQGEHLSAPFARLWREEARAAGPRGELGVLEPMLIDLLALGRRLDWRQLTAVAATVDSRETWAELGRLAREGGAPFDLVLATSLVEGSAERVVRFRIQHPQPETMDADLRLALAGGQGAVGLLLQRGVPVNRQGAPAPGPLVGLALLHPEWALLLRFALCAAGAYL